MFDFRTDLANERRDLYKKANAIEDEIPGVKTEEMEDNKNIRTTRVKILDKQGEDAIGKPIGTYITIDVKGLKLAREKEIEEAANIVARELKSLVEKHVANTAEVLVVGLGNMQITPDSLRTESYTGYRYNKTFVTLCTTIFAARYEVCCGNCTRCTWNNRDRNL